MNVDVKAYVQYKDHFNLSNEQRKTGSWKRCQVEPIQEKTAKKTQNKLIRQRLTSTTDEMSVAKWKSYIILLLILFICHSIAVLWSLCFIKGDVHAMRQGRLMSPTTFTALSGDLHVQIQFNADDNHKNQLATATMSAIVYKESQNGSELNASTDSDYQQRSIENTMLSSLIISKFIDEATPPPAKPNVDDPANGTLLQRRRKEILQNIPLYPDPRQNVTQVVVPCQTFMQGGLYEMQVITNMKITSVQTKNIKNISSTAVPTVTTTTLMPLSDERLRQTLDVRWPSVEMVVTPMHFRTYPEHPVEVTLRFPDFNCESAFNSQNTPEFWLELIYCGKELMCQQLQISNVFKSNILYAEQVRGFPIEKSFQLKCELFGLAGNYVVQLRPLVSVLNMPITRRFLIVDWSDKFVFNVYARSIFPCDPHTGIGVLYEYPNCILEQGDRVRVYAKLRADVASLKPPTSLHYVAEQRVVKNQYSLYFNCELFTEKYVEYCFVYVSQAISGAVADVRMDCVPTLAVDESDTGGWGPWSEWTSCSTNCLGGTRNRYRFCDSPPPRYGAKFCEGPSVETEQCGKSVSDTWNCIYETSGSNINKANRTDVGQEIGPGCRCGCIVHLGVPKSNRIIAGATMSCPGRSFWLIQVDGQETISLKLNFLHLPCATQSIKVRDGASLSSTLLIEINGGSIISTSGGSQINIPIVIDSTGAQLLVEFFAGEENRSLNNSTASTTENSSAAVANTVACTGGFMANVYQIAPKNASRTNSLLTATRLSVRSRTVHQKPRSRNFTIMHVSAITFSSIIILISALLGAQYMFRYRKYHMAIARRQLEDSRLHTPRGSVNSFEQNLTSRAVSTTTLLSEVIYMVKIRPKHRLRHSILRESVDAENISCETKLNGIGSEEKIVNCDKDEVFGSVLTLCNENNSHPISNKSPIPSLENDASETQESNVCNGTLTRKYSANDSESIISSGMSSLYNSTPTSNNKRSSQYSERYNTSTLKIQNSLMNNLKDSGSILSGRVCLSQLHAGSISASLTNGCYSSSGSVLNIATIRTTNPKDSKEKQNLRKLLGRPGSEFSLGNHEELEMDYYDYNVLNAGAAPGSYLGMDPAYLIWIPPVDSPNVDECEELMNKTEQSELQFRPDDIQSLCDHIKMPKYGHFLSPVSNTESSKSTATNTTPTSPPDSHEISKATTPSEANLKDDAVNNSTTEAVGRCGRQSPKYHLENKHQYKSSISLSGVGTDCREAISNHSVIGTKSECDIKLLKGDTVTGEKISKANESMSMSNSYIEKETSVVKSLSDLQGFLSIDDLQFADESESDQDPIILKQQAKDKTELKAEALPEMNIKESNLNTFTRSSRRTSEFGIQV